MAVFLYTLILLLAAFSVHVCVWKIRLPRNHSKALMFIFLSVLAIGILGAFVWGRTWIGMADFGEYFQIIAAYVAVMLAYVVTYSGIEVDSPSLVMVLDVDRAGPEGLAQECFIRDMNNERLVLPRINDLLKGGLAELDNGLYRLTPKGKAVARLFCFYRWLLGKKHKGG